MTKSTKSTRALAAGLRINSIRDHARREGEFLANSLDSLDVGQSGAVAIAAARTKSMLDFLARVSTECRALEAADLIAAGLAFLEGAGCEQKSDRTGQLVVVRTA